MRSLRGPPQSPPWAMARQASPPPHPGIDWAPRLPRMQGPPPASLPLASSSSSGSSSDSSGDTGLGGGRALRKKSSFPGVSFLHSGRPGPPGSTSPHSQPPRPIPRSIPSPTSLQVLLSDPWQPSGLPWCAPLHSTPPRRWHRLRAPQPTMLRRPLLGTPSLTNARQPRFYMTQSNSINEANSHGRAERVLMGGKPSRAPGGPCVPCHWLHDGESHEPSRPGPCHSVRMQISGPRAAPPSPWKGTDSANIGLPWSRPFFQSLGVAKCAIFRAWWCRR